jgi:hypothetical protein
MPSFRTGRREHHRHTPPLELKPPNTPKNPFETPYRSAVFTVHLLSETSGRKPGDPTTKQAMLDIFGVPFRTQERILASGQVRSLHNEPDLGPSPCGRPRVFTYTETAAIASYLDDPIVPLDDKGNPWKDIAKTAGVELPKTTHFKPPGKRIV